MGLSGSRGKVFYVDHGCPVVNCTTGVWTAPAGAGSAGTCWTDEVTKFTIVESVQSKKYGHDKSAGCQDVCAGTWSAETTLDAMLIPAAGNQARLHAGKVLWLQMFPAGITGECSTPVEGYAMIERISYTYDLETGLPISYTATVASKGPWSGLGPFADNLIGGFECTCTPA